MSARSYSIPDLTAPPSDAVAVAFDTETYDPNLTALGAGYTRNGSSGRDGNLIGVSVCYLRSDGSLTEPVYVPLSEHYGCGYPSAMVAMWLKRVLGGNLLKVGANLMYDIGWLSTIGVSVKPPYHDVQWTEVLLDENRDSYSLDSLGELYFGKGKGKFAKELQAWVTAHFGKNAGSDRNYRAYIHAAPLHIVGPYACEDAALPLRIYREQMPVIEEQGLEEVYSLEHSLIPMLHHMKMVGARVDKQLIDKGRNMLANKLEAAHKLLRDLAGREINVNVKDDMVYVLSLDGVEVPTTDKGNPSVTQAFLKSLKVPSAEAILSVRKYEKAVGTFIDGYMKFADGSWRGDSRIHAEFHPLRSDSNGTVSGRFSSSKPNLQNIPARDKEIGPLIRGFFVPEDDHEYASLDWSQIEYRIMLSYASGEEAKYARDMYLNDPDTDYHEMVRRAMSVDNRSHAKTINFGMLYGMGKASLAAQLGMSIDEAEPLFNLYHERAPYARQLMTRASNLVQARGYVMSISGRRHRFDRWEVYGVNKLFMSREEAWAYVKEKRLRKSPQRAGGHKALNRIIQGSAADAMKYAMRDAWEAGVFDVLVPHITVHDELDLSKPRTKQGDEALQELVHIMEHVLDGKMKHHVPLIVDVGLGDSWAEAKD